MSSLLLGAPSLSLPIRIYDHDSCFDAFFFVFGTSISASALETLGFTDMIEQLVQRELQGSCFLLLSLSNHTSYFAH